MKLVFILQSRLVFWAIPNRRLEYFIISKIIVLWIYMSIVFSNSFGVVNEASHTKSLRCHLKKKSSSSQKQSHDSVRCNTTLGSCKVATATPAGPSLAVSAAFVLCARPDSSWLVLQSSPHKHPPC